jgi:hypothetical protein
MTRSSPTCIAKTLLRTQNAFAFMRWGRMGSAGLVIGPTPRDLASLSNGSAIPTFLGSQSGVDSPPSRAAQVPETFASASSEPT